MPKMPCSFAFHSAAPFSLTGIVLVSSLAFSQSATAADMTADQQTGTASQSMHDMAGHDHNGHGNAPAGVHGAEMIGAGKFAFSYAPMFMRMSDNYIGSSKVSDQTILTVPSQMKMNGMPLSYHVVPTSMDAQSHMLNFMYGVTDNFNLMLMASYLKKSMDMTTYSTAMSSPLIGSGSASTSGVGDTVISSLWGIYHDSEKKLILNLGLNIPTGSATQNISMLSPMGTAMMPYMTMRASYGMQLGTGTYDLLPGLTFTNHSGSWSYGAAWKGRIALDDNSEGYHYGDLNELTAWSGYTPLPGVTYSARILESIQGSIHGSDPMIFGLMQGSNPNFYGGKHTDLLAGVEITGNPLGLKNKHLSLEAGKTILQNLNGPQLGSSWTFNANLGMVF
jgi:hypothetical protein